MTKSIILACSFASQLFDNSPEVARKNYYTGINKEEALRVLNKRKFS